MQQVYSVFRGSRSRLHRLVHSVRFRLTVWSVVILCFVLIVFSAFVVFMQAHLLQVEAENQLQLQSQRLANLYSPEDGQLRLSPLGNLDETTLPPNAVVVLVDEQGKIVQKAGAIGDADVKQLIGFIVPQKGGLNLKSSPITGNTESQRVGPWSKSSTLLTLFSTLVNSVRPLLPMRFNDLSVSDMFALFMNSVKSLGVARLQGLPLSTTYTPTASPLMGSPQRYLIYAAPVLAKGVLLGTLIVGRPLELDAQIQRLITTLLLAVPATLLMALIGGYWLASRAMRPVQRITRTAQTISETDLSRRLNLNAHDEIGELAHTFDQMLDRLQAAFDRQRQFTADASHELRTPLTIVNLEVNHALAHPHTPREYERALSIIGAENDYMGRLVNDLLILARADAGQLALKRDELDLGELTLDVVERLGPLARRNHLELITDDLPELRICGDRTYLTQMLTNLLENAIKYTGGVGRHVWIEGECQRVAHKEWGCIRIKDDGPGIAAEHLPHLFERFYRVDKVRSHNQPEAELNNAASDGSGLGLAIVQGVARSHGGTVDVHSEPGRGAIFQVRLPLSGQTSEG